MEQLPLLLLPLLLGERIWAAAGLSVGLSIERGGRERGGCGCECEWWELRELCLFLSFVRSFEFRVSVQVTLQAIKKAE